MPYPLHPAVVHFPLALAVLLPFLILAALLVGQRTAGRGPWLAVAAFAVLLPASAWAALETGSQQEDRVEAVVPESALSRHEQAAEALLVASAMLAAVVLAGLMPGGVGRSARWLSGPLALAVLILAVRTGDSGGELVYHHGAAAAYVSGAAGREAAASASARVRLGERARHREEET